MTPPPRKPVRGFALAECAVASFDRQVATRARVQRPDRYRLLAALDADAPRIARGAGVSYVAASFGAGAISQDLGAFNRLLAFDDTAGTLTVEAGVAIGDAQRFALAHGWYVPVAPGHPAATIGGCIAADAHGKNPARDGTFRRHVERLELWSPVHGARAASRTHNAELFFATCGGFGLTGTIVRAKLRLERPPRALVLRRMPVADLAAAARVLRDAANAPVLYGWHDGRARTFGRGVIRVGLASDAPEALAARTREVPDLAATIAPAPVTLWNPLSIAVADAWLRSRWCRAGQAPLAFADALFPLNDARRYFAAFGAAGLVEAQWLVPHARFDDFAGALADAVRRHRPRITLVASKLFDGMADGFAFDGAGIALALQLASPAAPPQRAFLEALAELAIAHDGRPNLIKDSTLDAATVRHAIPDFDKAHARLAAHNPQGLHRSALSLRLGL